VLLLYAIHRRDPVFTLAFLPNCVVYVRNLMLIRKERLAAAARGLESVERTPAAAPLWTAAPEPPSPATSRLER
jgi:hypothetical protein